MKKQADALETIVCPFEQSAPMEAYYKAIETINRISFDLYTDPGFLRQAGLPKFALI